MPHGEHRVNCLHCGKYYNCGDCITFTCHECDQAGHRGLSIDCPVCSREAEARRARIDAARQKPGKGQNPPYVADAVTAIEEDEEDERKAPWTS